MVHFFFIFSFVTPKLEIKNKKKWVLNCFFYKKTPNRQNLFNYGTHREADSDAINEINRALTAGIEERRFWA